MNLRTTLLIPVLLSTLGTALTQLTVQLAVISRLNAGMPLTDTRVWVLEGAGLAVTLALGCLVAINLSRVGESQQQRLHDAERGRLVAEADREALIAALGHEFRTPLHGVMGSLELLHDDMPDEERNALMSAATQSGRRLASLVEELLDSTQSGLGEESSLSRPAHSPEPTSILPGPSGHRLLLIAAEGSETGPILSSLGQPFDLVRSSAEARHRLHELDYELVLAEFSLTGPGLIEDLRPIADSRGALTAFVALSRPHDLQTAADAGWDDALVQGQRLRSELATLLDRWLSDVKMAS